MKKCSFKEHKEVNAISYCLECKVYLCNKCSNYHQGLFETHHICNLDKDINEIFIDICKEENHQNKLLYFCKNHNKLCCTSCIAKLEGKGNGKHKDCNICFIEDIKEEKRNKMNENIKFLEDLSNNLENSIKELKIIFEKINESKEELKLKIQKIFTKIRNSLNEREDELLLEVDNQYNEIYCDEDIIKEGEKLPIKIKTSLEKGKLINNEWKDNDNNNKLSSLINECINIEDNIEKINLINSNIKKCNLNKDVKIECSTNDKEIDDFIKQIKNFGKVSNIFSLESLILKNKEDLSKFYKLISNNIKINNIKLTYRASKDGLDLKNVVNKINNKSNLIFLIFTGNKRIFGVYIRAKLENIEHNKYFKDENAFIFSLDNNKIYKVLVPQNAIRFYNGYPILVGNTGDGNGFYFESGTIYDEGLLNNPKIYDFQKNSELTEGFNKFIELEIFEINL